MNARFRKGRKYLFNRPNYLSSYFIDTKHPLIYTGYDKNRGLYRFSYEGDDIHYQVCLKYWLDKGLLEYKEVK